jgi:hypothetical protein
VSCVPSFWLLFLWSRSRQPKADWSSSLGRLAVICCLCAAVSLFCRPRVGCAVVHLNRAPEVISEQACMDPFAADIWALGVMLFMMLTGAPLYTSPADVAFHLLARGSTLDLLR